MSQPLNFQQVILKLHDFWASHGCVIWEPYNVQVGAGTGNPATTLKVLGPEPWRVAYVEPSIRPDDGRFGENPNRMQRFYQYQVILKPDPGNPQELYLQSLEALGISQREHDIRFVEDNWESPALGAWGLGWEVWLDGQEITQFTYFQQAGGLNLDPVSVEITYGVERIVLALQNKESAWAIDWLDGVTYEDIMFNEEIEHCRYYFDVADVDALKLVYDTYEREYARALEGDALISAYDYVLKCSHLFNVLDTRGAIGVTERAKYFKRMRDMTRSVAKTYVAKREELEYPLMKMAEKWKGFQIQSAGELPTAPTEVADVLIEIGVEELPAADVDDVLAQLQQSAPALFTDLRLENEGVEVHATPRRMVVIGKNVAPRQTDEKFVAKGPPAGRAFDADGNPTKAAQGFARGKGVDVADLKVEEIDGGEYVTALVRNEGRPATEVLADALSDFVGNIKVGKSMRWNETAIAFSRPIRWMVALFGDAVIPFEYAGVASGNVTRGLRPYGSPEIEVVNVETYLKAMDEQRVVLDYDQRQATIQTQIKAIVDEIGGVIPEDKGLMEEVTNLIEAPTAFRGSFEEKYLELPRDVLVTVMRKHQRYFAVEDANGNLMNTFIGVRNGDNQHIEKVIHGNEHVIRARFSDAEFFHKEDIKKPLKSYLERLDTLTFQTDLGSMLEKNDRVSATVEGLGDLLEIGASDISIAKQASIVAKADLATNMVVEMTSLQGIMGREYAIKEGYPADVANVIFEHWLPRSAGDHLPPSHAGTLLAIADKLDSLVGLFAVGLAPKSTSDPYGLRRNALGIVQILVDKNISVDLRKAIDAVSTGQPVDVEFGVKHQIMEFVKGRLDSWLGETYDYNRDVINAVLKAQAHNPARAVVGIDELSKWVARDDWETILDNFARCVRITRTEDSQTINPDLLSEPQEQALYEAYQSASEKLSDDANVDGFLSAFEPMVSAVTAFFDNVLVHADDPAVRNNRIALLQLISNMQAGRADLSQLDNF
jgi:glycyl-tRNA synthetase